MSEEKVVGEVGFKEESDKKAVAKLSKEETMFRIGPDGKAIAEPYNIEVYDRNIEAELIAEGISLMRVIKQKKAVDLAMADLKKKRSEEEAEQKGTVDKEADPKLKAVMLMEFEKKSSEAAMDDIKSAINANVYEEGIAESRDIIRQLKKIRSDSVEEFEIEVAPCTMGEAYLALDKGKTVDGKDSADWVADLISKKVVSPSYTFDEAKKLKPDFKIALKDAVMNVSNYRQKSYREVMMEDKIADEKPLLVKKG